MLVFLFYNYISFFIILHYHYANVDCNRYPHILLHGHTDSARSRGRARKSGSEILPFMITFTRWQHNAQCSGARGEVWCILVVVCAEGERSNVGNNTFSNVRTFSDVCAVAQRTHNQRSVLVYVYVFFLSVYPSSVQWEWWSLPFTYEHTQGNF